MNVRATVERLGRTHVGKSWWVDLAEALVGEFEPVVAERDRLHRALHGIVNGPPSNPYKIARAALEES